MNDFNFSWDFVIQAILIFAIALLLYKLLPFYYQNIRRRKRLKRGVKKEQEAYKVLEKLGFKVIGQNVRYNYSLLENSIDTEITLEIDYLVKKGKKKFIIEVKSGNSATRITNSSTRRQILEYSMYIPNDGIYLLDMENEQLFEINFPASINKASHAGSKFLLVLTIALSLVLIASLLGFLPVI